MDSLSGPREGLDRLCQFLGIGSRRERKAVLNAPGPRAVLKGLRNNSVLSARRSSERERVLLMSFYGMPDERRRLWEKTASLIRSGADDAGKLIPSFEHRAFSDCDECYLSTDSEPAEVTAAFAEWPEAQTAAADPTDPRRPALALWPRLRSNLELWGELEEERRTSVARAVFGLATILDDSRILEYAATHADVLAQEYAFALESDSDDESATTEIEQPRTRSEAYLCWNDACDTLATAALRARGSPPEFERYAELARQFEAVENLHDHLSALLTAPAIEEVIRRPARLVRESSEENSLRWLREIGDQVEALWELTYLAKGTNTRDTVYQDVERAGREIAEAIRSYADADEALRAAEDSLRKAPIGVTDSLAAQLEAEQKQAKFLSDVSAARERRTRCRTALFQAVGPVEAPFDPTTDYVQEWGHQSDERSEQSGRPMPVLPAGEKEPARTGESSLETVGKEANAVGAQQPPPGGTEPNSAKSNLDDESARKQPDSVARGTTPSQTPVVSEASESQDTPPDTGFESATVEPTPWDDALRVLWDALRNMRLGLAHAIAEQLDRVGCDDARLPPADLARIALVGGHLERPDSPAAESLRNSVAQFDIRGLDRKDDTLRDALNLLVFAGTLRSAVIAPLTGGASLLRAIQLSAPLTGVRNLAVCIADHGAKLQGVHIDATTFAGTLSEGSWKQRFSELSNRVAAWRGRARSQRILYRPANAVWRRWQANDNFLGKLLGLLCNSEVTDRELVEAALQELCDQSAFNALVAQTDREVKANRRGSNIQARALTQLYEHARPAADLAREWLTLMEKRPGAGTFVEQEVDALRRDFTHLRGRAMDDLRNVKLPDAGGPLAAGVAIALHALSGFADLFQRGGSLPKAPSADAGIAALVGSDLLLVSKLDID